MEEKLKTLCTEIDGKKLKTALQTFAAPPTSPDHQADVVVEVEPNQQPTKQMEQSPRQMQQN